jgi:hypothetical protein
VWINNIVWNISEANSVYIFRGIKALIFQIYTGQRLKRKTRMLEGNIILSSSVDIVTRLLTGRSSNRGSIPGRSKGFFCSPQSPVRILGLPSLLPNGNMVSFPWG